MFSPLLLKLIGVAVLLGSVFLVGYNTAHKFDTAALARAQAEAQAKYDAKDVSYNQIAEAYEKTKASNGKAIITRNKIITQIIKTPIYSNVCLDSAGVSIINSAITRQPANTSNSDTTLPTAPATK